MNRNLLLGLLLLILGAGAVALIQSQKDQTTIAASDRDFAVKDIGSVHKIRLANRSRGQVVTLTRDDAGSGWLVSGKYRASAVAMNNLLDVLQNVRMKFIPHPNANANILEGLGMIGVKVELFDAEDARIKSYYVGASTTMERGTEFVMDGANQPYIVELPHLEGTVRPRFTLTEMEWRDRTFLDENPEDLVEISVEYPKQRSQSFRLTRDNGNYRVEPFYEFTPRINRPLSKAALDSYLGTFERMVAEYIENENPHRDSIIQTIPFSILTYRSAGDEAKTMRFYPIENPDSKNAPTQGIDVSPFIQRYFAECSWGDFLLVQQRIVGQLFRGYGGFFERVGVE